MLIMLMFDVLKYEHNIPMKLIAFLSFMLTFSGKV